MYLDNKNNYELLLLKLKEFKKKYYLNQMLKGLIWFSATFLVTYLSFVLLEYFGRFNTLTRTILFYTFILGNVVILVRFILFPLLSLFELRKALSYEQAASIIGKHFAEVKDKLLNTLQLHQQREIATDPFQKSLIEASVNQKIQELKPVPFIRAVDFKSNRKYYKYSLIPLFILLLLLLQAPNMLLESTQRLVNHNTFYAEKAPFDFILLNDSLTAIKDQDFPVQLKIKGNELPAEVSLLVNGSTYNMTGKSKTDWNYTLRDLQKDVKIQFVASGYRSEIFDLKVLPRPTLQKFDVELHFPAYLNKKNEQLQNVGDLTIPAGTEVSWRFYADHTDLMQLSFKDQQKIDANRKSDNLYVYRKRFLKDDSYYLLTSNRYLRNNDSIEYRVNVIPDAFPDIRVEQEQDSMRPKNLFFSGSVADDYGLKRLTFFYHFIKSDDTSKLRLPVRSENIALSKDKLMQNFYHFWDFSNLEIKPGDELEYFFEVWDNDGVNGSKSARSQKFFFKAPGIKEIEQQTATNNKELENQMESALRQAAKLQKEMEENRLRLLNKKDLDWQDQKAIEELLKRQHELQNTVEQLEKQYQKNLQQQTEYQPMSEETLQKHQELQQLLNQVLDDKTKKLLEEMKKLLEQQNKEDLQKKLDEMKFNDKEVQKELDRMLELFKQLQFQEKLEETINKLDELQKEQEQLSKDAEDKKIDSKELQDKQKELNEKFDDLQKKLDELDKKNEDLENKHELEDTKKDEKDIEEEMEQSEQNLGNQQKKKAGQNMKNAAQKMQKMSDKLKKMQEQMEDDAQMEDYQSLRQILENLVYVSLEQEKLMNEFKMVAQYNPKYIALSKRQQELKTSSKLIEDSLLALSKRNMQIKSFVNKEIGEINFNIDKSLSALAERDLSTVLRSQQFTMTHLNNLALMLSEVMEQMQEQMKSSKDCKNGDCKGKPNKKPGKGQKGMSMEQLRKMQEDLNDQMQGLKKGLKEGSNPAQTDKQLGKMAAQQEMLRRQLQKMTEEKSKDGKGSGDLKHIQDMMDKTEEDLYNKRITEETIKRQKDITTRLLQAEKAEKQQEMDDQRESKTADQKGKPSAPLLEKYLKAKEQEVELLRTVPPSLTPYYREKVKDYFSGGK